MSYGQEVRQTDILPLFDGECGQTVNATRRNLRADGNREKSGVIPKLETAKRQEKLRADQ